MDIFEAITTRRSIRRFTDKPISGGLLERILEAARWAPSHRNRQPWRLIVMQNRSLVRLAKRLSPGICSMPACVIAICSDRSGGTSRFSDYLAAVDCAMAAQNLLLAAHAVGLGACPVRSFSSAGIRELLKLPAYVEPELLVTVGYPQDIGEPMPRKSLTEILFRDYFGQLW